MNQTFSDLKSVLLRKELQNSTKITQNLREYCDQVKNWEVLSEMQGEQITNVENGMCSVKEKNNLGFKKLKQLECKEKSTNYSMALIFFILISLLLLGGVFLLVVSLNLLLAQHSSSQKSFHVMPYFFALISALIIVAVVIKARSLKRLLINETDKSPLILDDDVSNPLQISSTLYANDKVLLHDDADKYSDISIQSHSSSSLPNLTFDDTELENEEKDAFDNYRGNKINSPNKKSTRSKSFIDLFSYHATKLLNTNAKDFFKSNPSLSKPKNGGI